MYIEFYQILGKNFLKINGQEIEDVKEVAFKSSASNKAELVITIESEMFFATHGATGLWMGESKVNSQKEKQSTE